MTIWNNTFLAVLMIIAVTLMIIGWVYELSIQEDARIEEVKIITIGNHPECKVDIPLETWEHLNEMNVYHWVSACEDAVNVTE